MTAFFFFFFFFYDMQPNAHCKELVSYSVLSSSHVSVFSVFLLTQTRDKQHT